MGIQFQYCKVVCFFLSPTLFSYPQPLPRQVNFPKERGLNCNYTFTSALLQLRTGIGIFSFLSVRTARELSLQFPIHIFLQNPFHIIQYTIFIHFVFFAICSFHCEVFAKISLCRIYFRLTICLLLNLNYHWIIVGLFSCFFTHPSPLFRLRSIQVFRLFSLH